MAAATTGALVSCGDSKEPESSVASELPVEAVTGEVAYYVEPSHEVDLVPPIKKRVSDVDYALCTLNTEVFDFKTATISDLISTVTGEIDGKNVKDVVTNDFYFYGFDLSGKMFVELTKDKELVSEFNEDELDSYEFKALYTSADLLKDKGSFLTFGARTFIGLTKEEVESTFGKGSTSGNDENTFYYPDENGYILTLSYKDNVLNELYLFKDEPEEEEEGTT